MDEVMRQPAEWREKAFEFWDMSKSVEDDRLREQYAELAARYLDMAERLEDEAVADAILRAGARQD
jgi:hypothetical protein